MQAVWKAGEGNVKSFLEHLPDPKPPYTTLASIIKKLEQKGFLSSRLLGNVYIYKPSVSETEYKKKYIGTVVRDFFDNSYKDLVTFFIEQKKLTPRELKELADLIEKKK